MENIIIVLLISCIVIVVISTILILISVGRFQKNMMKSFIKISDNQKKIYSDILNIKNR